MKITNQIVTLIASLAALASAAPLQPDVVICSGEHASENCKPYVLTFRDDIPMTECQKLDSTLYKNVGTFSVRSGMYCRLWTDSDDCSTPPGGVAQLFPPGTDTLHDFNGQDIGSNITAYTCQECSACTYP